MAERRIGVNPLGRGRFGVVLQDWSGTHRYDVGASVTDLSHFGLDGHDAKEVIEESFTFLLERESPSSILARFDLPVIAQYFPEYHEEIGRRMRARA